ncbi:kinase D-interacting substrate of 220 kDa B [Aplysia californica]|uniref:Kinase D-interacting substrate of 220 kDa B n=1 Tax=Aplysia californica TaxID=6500 RepID=A0ABM0JTG8_APLCA|nr:kinase D-interacting substrate of 220 kDa B [Aplysia californica]
MSSFKAQLLWDNISRGDLSAVHTMLESANVNLEERDANGCTFLMVASEQGAVNIVRELLQAGVDPTAVDNENWNALLCASKEGHLEIVMELLEMNVDLEHTDMCGWTALMWACYRGNTLVVSELLERGANPNVKADHHMTCLSWAAGRGYTEVVKLLIDKGAKVNMPDKYGTTALIWACRRGHLDIVDALLGEGVAVDASGMNSWTPLLVATKGGHFDVVRSVLSMDPNVNATDKDGLTALAIAAKDGYAEVVNDLLRKGAYVNLVDRNGDSILIHAVKGGYIEIVKALLKKYVDVDVPGQEGKTAIYCAVEKGYTEIVKLLLNSNPDLELSTKDEDTPLLRAVRMRNEECVRLLIDRGAKVSASDKRGDTALHIAIRARAKRITELLLCNPRHSRLLYRLNKAGESPYSMDTYYQRGILPQIYGHGKLNATDAENLLGYEIYSSALADILSEPGLMTPITMGLYAKWGSGKSFLLDKLRVEMRSFTQQNSQGELNWSWLTAFLFLLLNTMLGEVLGLTLGWRVGLAVGLGLLPLQYAFIGIIIFFTVKHDFSLTNRISAALARKQKLLALFMQMLFCVPKQRPVSDKHSMASSFSVRFLFSDCTRLTSVGGEKSLAAMIGTLCEAVEKEYGVFIARLFRVFKPTPGKSRSSRFKSICCVPYFIIFLLLLICVQVGVGLAVAFGIKESVAVDAVLIALVSVVGLALVTNLYTWGQMLVALVFSQKKRVIRAADSIDELKMDGFMQQLKTEVDLMSRMVNCLDSFTQDQTRLVVIVDGLDSCEQDKVLQVLDTVKSLFSDEGAPFITILAVDPHIIIKGIEQNLRSSFQDSNVNGFDYLRNVVHLPFYLQSQGMRIQQVEPVPSHQGAGESPSKATRQDSTLTNASETRVGLRKASRNLSTSVAGGSLSDSVPGTIYASSYDLTSSAAKNDYFSDINPRSMRRLMNIVAVTARLLRAYNIDFKWHRLAAWINLTEQWPYRLSWIIYHFEEAEVMENSASLYSLYKRIVPSIPATKEQDPLLEIDRNVRKLEASLTSKSGNFPLLSVADLKKFLPCTINLDPYLRKLIRENQHNLERQQAEIATLGGVFPPPQPPPAPMLGSRLREQAASERVALLSSPVRFGAPLTPAGMLYGMYGAQPQVSYAAALAAAAAMQQQQQNPQGMPQFFSPGAAQNGMRMPGADQRKVVDSAVKHPNEFFMNYSQPVVLSQCSVQEVCDLLSRLRGLSPSLLSEYQASVRENNISGLVLAMCDLSELQPILAMRFGDWQLFRSAVSSLLNFENEDVPSGPGEDISSASSLLASKTGPVSMSSSVNSYSTAPGGGGGGRGSLPGRSMSLQEPVGGSRTTGKSELQRIQERKFKRNDSIVQQLSYETAILKSAVSEFVEESEEEEEEDEEEIEAEKRPGVENRRKEEEEEEEEGSLRKSEDKEARSPEARARFKLGQEYLEDIPSLAVHTHGTNSMKDKQIHSSASHPGKNEKLLEHLPTGTVSGGDEVSRHQESDPSRDSPRHSGTFTLSGAENPVSLHDISPYIKVLDGPMGRTTPHGSGEFVPLLGSIQLHSSHSSNEFVPVSQHSSLSQIPEIGATGSNTSSNLLLSTATTSSENSLSQAASSQTSFTSQKSSQPSSGPQQQPFAEASSTKSTALARQQAISQSGMSQQGSSESPTKEFHFSSVDPHLDVSPLITPTEGEPAECADLVPDSQDHHRPRGPLHTLSSSIERLARPVLGHFNRHHHHQQHHNVEHPPENSSTQEACLEEGRAGDVSVAGHPRRALDHEDLFQRSFTTIVEMSSPQTDAGTDDFHHRLGVAFANVDGVEDEPAASSRKSSQDRETVL